MPGDQKLFLIYHLYNSCDFSFNHIICVYVYVRVYIVIIIVGPPKKQVFRVKKTRGATAPAQTTCSSSQLLVRIVVHQGHVMKVY